MAKDASRDRRVLVILHEEVLGGATLSVLRCVPGLVERGWRFSFWAPRPSPVFDELRERGHDVDGFPRPHAYSLRALRLDPGPGARLKTAPAYAGGLWRRIRALRPALVHANSLTTLADAALARAAGVPTVFHVHEMLAAGAKGAAARRLAHLAATEIVAVSEACAAALGGGDRRPRVVHECVTVPDEPAPIANGRPLVVGTVGVISRRKGSDVFVEAARLVRERAPEVRFEIIGAPTDPLDAEWARGVLARAAALGVEHRTAADVPAAIREWDVFALPSRRDPFPISMLEAMASGLPVIGAAVDGIPEQVDSDAGVLVAPDDPRSLAEAILTLAALSPSARAAIGAAGRRRVTEEFSIERQVEGLDAAYRAALGGGR